VDRLQGHVSLGLHLYGLQVNARSITRASAVRLEPRFGRATLVVTDERESRLTIGGLAAARAEDLGRELASQIGVTLEIAPNPDDEPDEDEEKRVPGPVPATIEPPARRVSLSTMAAVVVLVAAALAAAAVALSPELRHRACRFAVAPRTGLVNFSHFPAVRLGAVRALAADSSPARSLALVRLLATVDPVADAELAHAALAALSVDATPVAEVNRSVAERLGRTVDANGGVLAWFPVDERLRPRIDDIASDDLHRAWGSWATFAAGELTSREEFLYAVGAALGDERPLHFAIKRGGFFIHAADGPAFEGQPEPIASYADEALAHTVGEALALKLWSYLPDQDFPADFHAWWREYAASHHLPPSGCRRTSDRASSLPAERAP